MRIILGVAVGITLSILAHTFGWRWLAWFLSRIETVTPDWSPKMRTWINGELQP